MNNSSLTVPFALQYTFVVGLLGAVSLKTEAFFRIIAVNAIGPPQADKPLKARGNVEVVVCFLANFSIYCDTFALEVVAWHWWRLKYLSCTESNAAVFYVMCMQEQGNCLSELDVLPFYPAGL